MRIKVAPFDAETRKTPSSVIREYSSSTMGREWPWHTSGFWYEPCCIAIFPSAAVHSKQQAADAPKRAEKYS